MTLSRRRAVRATFGSGVEVVVRQGIQFVVLLALARLLTPHDFGGMAILASIVALGVLLSDAGVSVALLQREPDDLDLATALTITTVVGIVASAGMATTASWTTGAVGHPELAAAARALAPAIMLTAFGAVPAAMVSRQLRFGRAVVVGVAATCTSGIVAVILAISGLGIWSLVWQSLTMTTLWTVGMWRISGIRPRYGWNRVRAARLMRTGRWVASTNALDVAYSRAQSLLLGAVFGITLLGYYSRADQTQQLTAESASTAVGRVALPVFSTSRGNPEALAQGVRTGMMLVAAVMAPAMGLLSALSTPFVLAVFGDQWTACANFLSILCLAGFVTPLNTMLLNALYAADLARTVFLLDTLKRCLGLALLAGALTIGPQWVALAQVATAVIVLAVNARAVWHHLDLPPGAQVRCVGPALALAGSVSLVVWMVSATWNGDPAVKLLTLGVGGIACYMLAAHGLRLGMVTQPIRLLVTSLRPSSGPPTDGTRQATV